jgi:hypothetical protein
MELWERDYIDFEGPGLVKFERGGLGAMRFGAVDIGLDCVLDDKARYLESTFPSKEPMRWIRAPDGAGRNFEARSCSG